MLREKIEQKGIVTTDVIEPVLSELKNHVAHIQYLLRAVQKSHPIHLPLGTAGLVRDLTGRLTDRKLEFFLNISYSMEYSTQPGLISDVVKKIKENGGQLPNGYDDETDLVVINFYATQSKDILRHSVFAHEIGHVLVKFDKKFSSAYQATLKLVEPKFPSALSGIEAAANVKLHQWQINQIANILVSWVEELFVDLVSIHSMGPAAFFSMRELGTEEIDFASSISDTHPAFYKRIYLMWRALDKSGFPSLLQTTLLEKLKDFVAYSSEFEAFDSSITNPIYKALNALFDVDFLGTVADVFSEANLPGKYSKDEFEKDVPKIIPLFKLGIAACDVPNFETTTFTDISGATLLNAGWIIEDLGDLSLDKLNPLLNKALANHYLKAQWEKCK